MKVKKIGSFLLACSFPFYLTACQNEGHTNSTQVAATVDGQDITIHQINKYLKDVSVDNDEVLKKASEEVLNDLIRQQLLFNQAEELEVDRNPEILSAINDAKRKIIIEAYLNKVLGESFEVSEAEIREFYDKHPEKFAKRQVFFYNQTLIANDDFNKLNIKSELDAYKSNDQLLKLLQENRAKFKSSALVKDSSNLSAGMLVAMQTLKPGDFGVVNLKQGMIVLYLNSVSNAAIPYEFSKNAISTALKKSKKLKSISKLIESLKSQAKIEYKGEFVMDGETNEK